MTATIDHFVGSSFFLSDAAPTPIVLPRWHAAAGQHVQTLAHGFQSAKVDNAAQARLIASCSSPDKAWRLGQQVHLRPGWDDLRLPIMLALLKLKFAPDTPLSWQLVDTGVAEIVESSDTFWGVRAGVGENHHGKLLMRVREQLQHMAARGPEGRDLAAEIESLSREA